MARGLCRGAPSRYEEMYHRIGEQIERWGDIQGERVHYLHPPLCPCVACPAGARDDGCPSILGGAPPGGVAVPQIAAEHRGG